MRFFAQCMGFDGSLFTVEAPSQTELHSACENLAVLASWTEDEAGNVARLILESCARGNPCAQTEVHCP